MSAPHFCSFFILIIFLRPSIQMDLVKPYHERYKMFINYFEDLFMPEKFKSVLNSSTAAISFECSTALQELLKTENYNQSAQFFDAWSSIPSGLLYKQYTGFGHFEECEAATLSSNLSGRLEGKYSLLSVYLALGEGNDISKHHIFNVGICLPHSCNKKDTLNIFSKNYNTATKFFELFNKETNDNCMGNCNLLFKIVSTKDDITKEDKRAALIAIVIFSFIFTLMMLSSCYEFIVVKKNGKPHTLLKSFSVITNSKKLFQITPKNSVSPKVIECLNGIRALSLIWNVYGHTYMWSCSRFLANRAMKRKIIEHDFGRVLTSANLSVDTFLLLSGLLTAWIGLNRMSSKKTFSIKLMYLHRFLRLIPSFAATIIFASGLFVFLGSGPFWYEHTTYLSDTCQKYWWRSLFLISNFFPFSEMCIGHSWFLAVDTQLYILSPFILMGLKKWRTKMVWILILMIALTRYFVYAAILRINKREFAFDGWMTGNYEYETIEHHTHMRAAPWLIGLLLGYFLFQQRNRKHGLSRIKTALGWMLALALLILILYGPQHSYDHPNKPTVLESALYESLGRCCWALSLCWIIFSCYMGYSNSINSFLSHEVWQVIARLNYTIYIVKTFINISNNALQNTDDYLSHYAMIAEFWADFGISASFAIILSLSIELPFIAIERYFTENSWVHF